MSNTQEQLTAIPVADHRAEIEKMLATLAAISAGLEADHPKLETDGTYDYFIEINGARSALKEMRDLLPRFVY